MQTELKKRCNNCKFFMTQDEGYSNYTVLETMVHCIKNNNSGFPCLESYSWNREDSPDYEVLKVAETCQYYKEGEGLHFDVDGDETIDNQNADEEQKQTYNEYMASAGEST